VIINTKLCLVCLYLRCYDRNLLATLVDKFDHQTSMTSGMFENAKIVEKGAYG